MHQLKTDATVSGRRATRRPALLGAPMLYSDFVSDYYGAIDNVDVKKCHPKNGALSDRGF
jgi:hypothetical protein